MIRVIIPEGSSTALFKSEGGEHPALFPGQLTKLCNTLQNSL